MRSWPALDLTLVSAVARAFRPANDKSEQIPILDRVSVLLDDLQPRGIVEMDGELRVFFTSPAERDRAAALIRATFDRHDVIATAVDVADEDWARRSQADLRAVRVGNIIVAPPWDHATGTGEQLTIVIRPSIGFGTGHHPSTRLCLAALQKLDVSGRSVIDVGTGSGVLAIAAARLGATPVIAIDTDPDALESARQNIALNDVTDRVELRLADFRELHDVAAADVILANLTGRMVARHAPEMTRLAGPDGSVIVGGFTRDEEDSVRAALTGALDVVGQETEDDWVTLMLRRRT